MAGDELLRAEHLLEPRLPLGHLDRPALEAGLGRGVARDAGLLEQRRARLDALGGGIDERIERVAVFDRHRPLLGIVERVGELRRRLQRLQERDHVLDLGLGVEAVLAPRRHHRFRIIDPRIEDVVEQPLVGAAGIADLRQVRPDIARRLQRPRPHHVAGEAAAAAVAIERELLALGRIARHLLDDDLAALAAASPRDWRACCSCPSSSCSSRDSDATARARPSLPAPAAPARRPAPQSIRLRERGERRIYCVAFLRNAIMSCLLGLLLQADIDHLGAGHAALGSLRYSTSVLSSQTMPDVLHRIGGLKAAVGAGLAAEQAMKVGADRAGAVLVDAYGRPCTAG